MLIDAGLSPQRAAYVQSVFGIALIVGRLTMGFLLDRFFAPYVMVGSLLGRSSVLPCMRSAPAATPLCLGLIIGFGVGAEFDVLGFLIHAISDAGPTAIFMACCFRLSPGGGMGTARWRRSHVLRFLHAGLVGILVATWRPRCFPVARTYAYASACRISR